MKVSTKITRFSIQELAKVLDHEHLKLYGTSASENFLLNVCSHVSLECGRHDDQIIKCRNYNLGNISLSKADYKFDRPYWALKCREQQRNSKGKLNGKWVWTEMKFAANPTLEKGAEHYISFFWSKMYRHIVLHEMRVGTSHSVALALSKIWYMTADPQKYAKALIGTRKSIAPYVRRYVLLRTVPKPMDITRSLPPVEVTLESNDEIMIRSEQFLKLSKLETMIDFIWGIIGWVTRLIAR